jgi:hypothetical protein
VNARAQGEPHHLSVAGLAPCKFVASTDETTNNSEKIEDLMNKCMKLFAIAALLLST